MKKDKNKVGIIAVTNYNFGSLLQSFALLKTVEKMGYDVEIISYHEKIVNKLQRFQNKEYICNKKRSFERNLFFTFFKRKCKQQRLCKFEEFVRNYIHLSIPCCEKKQLSLLANKYNFILLGSDQVWHPMNLAMDYFTLNFVPDDIRKIAYAPSFGVSTLPNKMKPAYQQFISRFQFLSCREETGIQLVRELTGREAEIVCDPTLLLNKDIWEDLSGKEKKVEGKYVFCYFIGNNPNQREMVVEFSKQNHLKIVSLLHIDEYISTDENYADITPYDIGPLEFLNLIKNSEYVMTDSFHATLFSLVFHKCFYTFNRFENNRGNSTTNRIDNLLTITNTQHRKVKTYAFASQLEQFNDIDYVEVDKRIETFRNKSLHYLMTALYS